MKRRQAFEEKGENDKDKILADYLKLEKRYADLEMKYTEAMRQLAEFEQAKYEEEEFINRATEDRDLAKKKAEEAIAEKEDALKKMKDIEAVNKNLSDDMAEIQKANEKIKQGSSESKIDPELQAFMAKMKKDMDETKAKFEQKDKEIAALKAAAAKREEDKNKKSEEIEKLKTEIEQKKFEYEGFMQIITDYEQKKAKILSDARECKVAIADLKQNLFKLTGEQQSRECSPEHSSSGSFSAYSGPAGSNSTKPDKLTTDVREYFWFSSFAAFPHKAFGPRSKQYVKAIYGPYKERCTMDIVTAEGFLQHFTKTSKKEKLKQIWNGLTANGPSEEVEQNKIPPLDAAYYASEEFSRLRRNNYR